MAESDKTNPIISLVSIHSGPSAQAVPLATAFLKSAAKDIPVDIILLEFFSGDLPDKCAHSIAESVPDAVGFSMYLWNRELCLEIAKQLRILLPSVKLFAGGPEVTADPESVLKTGVFNIIISGEGELPFVEMCNKIAAGQEFDDITCLFMPDISTVVPPASDLDKIPSPFLTGVLDTNTYSGILWQLSRGCSFSCDFCFDSSGRSGVRRFSLKRLEAELQLFASTGITQVFVIDSTFNQDVQRAKKILRMIRKIAPRIHFHFEVRSEFIDREMAYLFAQITCSIQIGLQSANSEVLKQVGRKIDRDDFRDRVDLLNESGAVFGFDLMYGLPGDTLQGYLESLDFALSLYPNHLDIFLLAVLPGTALHLKSGSIGIQHLSSPPYTLISSPTFSTDDINQAKQIASACDVFYTRGKAVAWFNGVLAVLGVKPSDLLRRLGEMLISRYGAEFSENDFDDGDIRNLQRVFLSQIFASNRLKRFLPLVLDLVDYHYHYAAALLATQNEASQALKDDLQLLDFPLYRSDSLQMASFNYEILEIIEVGAPDIRWMCDHLEPLGSSAAIYPRGDTVCTQSFDVGYYTLLESLDGETKAGELALKLGLPAKKAVEFLKFGLQEGFIVHGSAL